MKNITGLILGLLLFAIVFSFSGCGVHGQGETPAEGHRRQKRISQLERQMLIDDIEATLHTDQPTRLSRKKLR